MTPSAMHRNRPKSTRQAWWVVFPATLAVAAGLMVATGVFAVRTKVVAGETVEVLAKRFYGDAARASVIRAANNIAPEAQPAVGQRVSIPSPTIHTVERGETLGDIADLFLVGEGGEELLAESNGLNRGAKLKPGEVLTVFAEVQLTKNTLSAEDIAKTLLGDPALGARIRRYNGLADGAKLPPELYVPLVGLEINPNPVRGIATAAPPASTVEPKDDGADAGMGSTPTEVVENTPPRKDHLEDKPKDPPSQPATVATAPPPADPPPSTTLLPGAENIDMSVPR